MSDPDRSLVSLTWMFESLQTEIHLGHELAALVEVLAGPGVHLVQGQARYEPEQSGHTDLITSKS